MGLGFIGAVLILYSLASTYMQQTWQPLEAVAAQLSDFLTLAGAIFTAGSVYFVSPFHPPSRGSVYVVAPVVILTSALALLALLRFRRLPSHLVSGFALLAISGGLQRLLPLPAAYLAGSPH